MLYFNNEISLDQAFEINEIFLDGLKEVVVGMEGVYDTLEYLSAKYMLVIATNGPTSAVETKLSKINCLQFVNNIFSADMTVKTLTKPSKEYFEKLKDYIKFYETKQMLIVGDSLNADVKGGMNSNIDSCWLNTFNEELEAEYQPTYIIKTLRELKKIL